MYQDIKEYMKTCEIYQKRGKSKRKEPLYPIKIGQAFERIRIDQVELLPITTRNNWYIIVATDYLICWPEAQAVPDAKALTFAKFIFEEIVCKHGTFRTILSDQAKNFRNEVIKVLYENFLI